MIAKRIRKENDNTERWLGITSHSIRDSTNPSSGLPMKKELCSFLEENPSFEKSFKASAMGCSSPPKDTLFGPFRIWMYPSTLRSSKVKNATLTSTSTNTSRYTNAEWVVIVIFCSFNYFLPLPIRSGMYFCMILYSGFLFILFLTPQHLQYCVLLYTKDIRIF